MKNDSVFRSVIQGWGVAALLIGLFMFYMGANTYIQSYKQTDWVFGQRIHYGHFPVERRQSCRGGISYSMTYEYEVDGMRYTGEYGPLANSIEVGKSIRIKYDPNAPKTPPAFWHPVADLALVIIGTILAVRVFHVGHPRPAAEIPAEIISKRDPRLRAAGRETRRASKGPHTLGPRYSYGDTQYPPNPCADTHIPAFGFILMLIQNAKF